MNNQKIFIIGIDGGTWDVLDPLIEEGLMPNLEKLVKEGVCGVLESTRPPETAPAWTTFQTGVNPGKHGIYEFNNYKHGTYQTWFVNSRAIPLQTIWQISGEQGKKVIAVNVPVTYPPYEVNGCLVSGMLTPSTKSTFTYPESLSKEIFARVPGYKIITTQEIFNLKGIKHFLDELKDTERKRTQVMKYLIQRHPWHLGMIHYQSVDVLQHALFWYLDPENSLYDPQKHALIKDFFRVLDNCIGELLTLLPPSTQIIVMSDHGSIPVRKMIHLNVLLSQHGWLNVHKRDFKHKFMQSSAAFILGLDKFNIHRLVLGRKRRKVRERIIEGSLIDWSRTKAFVINGWTYGNIHINLKGREKAGIIPIEEYEELRNDIIKALYELKDSDGIGVVKRVYTKEELYRGPFRKDAPDIIVEPKTGYEFSSSIFQRKSVFKELKPRRGHLGNHSLEGIFAFHGDVIRSDKSKGKKVNKAHIVDLFPTILYMQGLKIPDYTDGKILEWLFDPEYSKKNPPRYKKMKEMKTTRNGDIYQEKDKKEIEKRLKDLGYL